MIRNDLIEKLQNKDLDKIFLQHRDIDQGNYRVARIDDNVVCWNPETGMIMDYFYDDQIEREWFDIRLIYLNIKTINRFEINRLGVLRRLTKYTEHIKKIYYNNSGGDPKQNYPMHSIPVNSEKSGEMKVAVHRLIAMLFIPNIDPDNKKYVDHINRDRMDYSINNLRWVTSEENNKNLTRRLFTGNCIYEAYSDSEFKNLKFTLTEEELYNSIYDKGRLRHSVNKDNSKGLYKKLYWKVIDLDIKNYLKGDETVDESKWVLHYSGRFFVHPLGIVRSNSDRVITTLGTVNGGYKYFNFSGDKFGGRQLIHRVVAEVFLNNNEPISKELQIDHLDTDRFNNRAENLKICTRKENLSNPITRQKHSKRVMADGIVYNSLTECGKHYGITRSVVLHRTKSDKYPNFSLID